MTLAADIRCLTTSRARVLYVGCVGNGNMGDEVIYECTRKEFAREAAFLPHRYATRGVGLGRRCVAYDAIMLGGGTLIKKDRRMYLGAVERALACSGSPPFVAYGTGVADPSEWAEFGYPIDCDGWKAVLSRAAFIGVRGPLSKELLGKWGIRENVEIIGDPALLATLPHTMSAARSRRVAVSFGPSAGRVFGGEKRLLELAGGIIRALEEAGWRITLFPVHKRDKPFLRAAAAHAGIGSLPMHRRFLDLRATLEMLARQDLVIGQKLHSVVLACCVYTPAIMLEYRTKCRDFMRSISRETWCFRTDTVQVSDVLDAAGRVSSDLGRHRRALREVVEDYRNRLRCASSRVREVFRARPAAGVK
jgi:polysaccharide pyruvyl transferase WcaK-like protein